MDIPMENNDNVLVVTDDFQYYIPNLNPGVRQIQPPAVTHQNAMAMGGHIQIPQSSQASHLAPPPNMHQHGMIGTVANMRQVHGTLPSGMDMGDGLQMLGNICMQTQQENLGPQRMNVARTVMQSVPGQNCNYTQLPISSISNTVTMQPPQVNTMVTQAKDHVYSRNVIPQQQQQLQQRDNLNFQTNEAYKAALMIMNPENTQENMPTYQAVQLNNVNLNINANNTSMLGGNVNAPINTFTTNVNTLNAVNTINAYHTIPQQSTQVIDNCQLTDLRGTFTTDLDNLPKVILEDQSKGKKKMLMMQNDIEVAGADMPVVEQVVVHISKPRKKGSGRKAKAKTCYFCKKDLVEPDKSVLFRITPCGKSEFLDTCNACMAVENAKIAASKPQTAPVIEPVQTLPAQDIQPTPVFTIKAKPKENFCEVCSKEVEKIVSVIAKITDGKITYLNACNTCSFKPKSPEEKKEKKRKLKKKKKKKLEEQSEAADANEPVDSGDAGSDGKMKTIGTQVEDDPYKWKCSSCKKIFNSKTELQKHRRQAHRYYRLFQCDNCTNKIKIYSSSEVVHCLKCNKQFDQTNYSPYTLSKQFYVKRTVQELKCPICQKEFSSRRGVLEHKKIHTNIKPHLCNICGKTFRTLPPLRIHMRVHTGEKPYKCEMCGKCFRQSSALNMHVRHHTGETPYSCQICGKKFARRSQYTKHMESHTEKTFECVICNKKFPTEVRLKRHHRKHTEDNPYRCHICGMNYEENSAYRRHMQKHDAMNPYRCQICGKQFGGQRGLMEHASVHQEGNEFKCGICGDLFLNKTDLDTHIQTHFIEKPFECPHCDLCFSTKSLLEHHTNFHSSKEFFDCKKCGKKFTKRVTLDMHMRRHDGAKPFKCFMCGEEYLWSTTLDSHMKTHYVHDVIIQNYPQ